MHSRHISRPSLFALSSSQTYQPTGRMGTKMTNFRASLPVDRPTTSYWLKDRHPIMDVKTSDHLPTVADTGMMPACTWKKKGAPGFEYVFIRI